jgi:hypothetical protein
MIQSNVKGTFPCYAPEMDYPERTVPLSEELWDILITTLTKHIDKLNIFADKVSVRNLGMNVSRTRFGLPSGRSNAVSKP